MEYFPSPLSRPQSDDLAARIQRHFAAHGYGLWAVEVRGGAPFIGFVGLSHLEFEAAFSPAVEIGWRLAFAAWGKGYATEAARAALRFALEDIQLPEVVSFTAEANQRSRTVMERIGLTHDESDDFDHPGIPRDHPLCRHVLYRINR